MFKISVYSFTEKGKTAADKICSIKLPAFRCEKPVFCMEENSTIDEEKFRSSDAHIFIGAVGIAVRKIGQYINSKMTDPAVIAVDENAEYVIPVLSGHIGGANDLARIIANSLNASAVITTATDINGYNAIDNLAAENRLAIKDREEIVIANSKMLKGEKVKVSIGANIDCEEDETGIFEITDYSDADVHICSESDYIIGVGCRKNTDEIIFEDTLMDVLTEYSIGTGCIDRICSINFKAEEKAILDFCAKYGIMYETYSSDELNSVEGDFDESDFVQRITGVSNVSERSCAYAGSFFGSFSFVLKRRAVNGITISIIRVRKRIKLNGKA